MPACPEVKRCYRRWLTAYPGRTLAETIVLALALAAVVGIVALHIYYGIPAVMRQRAIQEKTACMQNAKGLARALLMYLADNDQVLPPSRAWCSSLTSYLSHASSLSCPAAQNTRCSYAFSGLMSGMQVSRVPDPDYAVAIFESDAGWNASDGPELLPDAPRHMGGDVYVFASGSTSWYPRKQLGADPRGNPIWAKEPDADRVIWEPVLKDETDDP